MKIVKQNGFGGTTFAGGVTYRQVFLYGAMIILAFLLFRMPLFEYNLFAMIAYFGFAMLVIGMTPTKRPSVSNIYGILFRKPTRMVITELSTVKVFGHGVKEVILRDDLPAPAFRLSSNDLAFVYHVTSHINYWSQRDDYEKFALEMKSAFNIMEAGERIHIVMKKDSDTSMHKLRDYLLDHESWQGDDYQRMSERRARLLTTVGGSSIAQNTQQYLIVIVKPKNVSRVTEAIRKTARLIQPATYPGDVLLAASGFDVTQSEMDGE